MGEFFLGVFFRGVFFRGVCSHTTIYLSMNIRNKLNTQFYSMSRNKLN